MKATKRKLRIEVRKTGEATEIIQRKIYSDSVGNFIRCACRYKGQTFIVNSDEGDLGDPFRANDTYLDSLFIIATRPCAWNL